MTGKRKESSEEDTSAKVVKRVKKAEAEKSPWQRLQKPAVLALCQFIFELADAARTAQITPPGDPSVTTTHSTTTHSTAATSDVPARASVGVPDVVGYEYNAGSGQGGCVLAGAGGGAMIQWGSEVPRQTDEV
ncbi:hypothetical protein EIP91_001029 [Steccherinum ochraceum]|uniref:Uncharacterized protein n=1 Tax=Steccherinum ochraceum TaxID=92696 RepID=A0A4R0RH40_9APHY|nr:hypothetical protein EIP91_001029 [Steccherinum ochraceum]